MSRLWFEDLSHQEMSAHALQDVNRISPYKTFLLYRATCSCQHFSRWGSGRVPNRKTREDFFHLALWWRLAALLTHRPRPFSVAGVSLWWEPWAVRSYLPWWDVSSYMKFMSEDSPGLLSKCAHICLLRSHSCAGKCLGAPCERRRPFLPLLSGVNHSPSLVIGCFILVFVVYPWFGFGSCGARHGRG